MNNACELFEEFLLGILDFLDRVVDALLESLDTTAKRLLFRRPSRSAFSHAVFRRGA